MGAFTYPRSEPGSAGHMDLVERLNAITSTLRELVVGLPETTLAARAGEGGWSVKETLGHLCDVGHILHKRVFVMIHQEMPRLQPYDAEELAAQRNANDALAADLLYEFSTQRGETVDMLTELVHWNWARPGRHPTLGRLSIRQQVEHWLEHEDEHLAQIRSLTQASTNA